MSIEIAENGNKSAKIKVLLSSFKLKIRRSGDEDAVSAATKF